MEITPPGLLNMTYATQQNMIDRFGELELTQLTDRANTGAIDAAVMARALEDADGVINGYLKAKYALPLDPVPLVLARTAADIARYFLYEDRVTEIVEKRYQDAVRFLKNMADGSVQLGVDATNQAPIAAGGPQYDAPNRQFTNDTLADY